MTATGVGGYYKNESFGWIYDKNRVLRGIEVDKTRGTGTKVWVRRWAGNSLGQFVIDSVAVETEQELEDLRQFVSGLLAKGSAFSICFQKDIVGPGLVMNTRGEIYMKELAQETCTLITSLHRTLGSQVHVGEWLMVRARAKDNRRGYWIVSAERYSRVSRDEHPPMAVARMPNGEYAVSCTLTKVEYKFQFKVKAAAPLSNSDYFFTEVPCTKREKVLNAIIVLAEHWADPGGPSGVRGLHALLSPAERGHSAGDQLLDRRERHAQRADSFQGRFDQEAGQPHSGGQLVRGSGSQQCVLGPR